LERLLFEAGFDEVRLTKLGGWDSALANMISLWVVRRPGLKSSIRGILKALLVPLIWILRHNESLDDRFIENDMVGGIAGVALKGAQNDS
jgi:hypothetical protein